MRSLLLLAMLVAFGVNAQQNSNYILPYRTQTRMLQVLQVNPNVTRDSVLVRNENGWLGSTPFPTWNNLSGRPTFAAVAVSGAYSDLLGLPSVFPSSIANVTGLQTALNGKISIGSSIPYNTLSGVPTVFASTIGLVSGLQSELDNKQPVGNYLTSFTELDPTVPAFAKSLTGVSALRGTTDPLYRPISYVPTSAEIATSLGYIPYNGTTNPNGYITSSSIPGIAINTATIGLSRSTLNSTYPNTPVGFRVSCPDILLGGAIYIRITTGANGRWQTISAPPTL